LEGGSACRKAATYTQNNTNRINAHRHPCLEWDSNLRSQYSSERRQFMLLTVRPLCSACRYMRIDNALFCSAFCLLENGQANQNCINGEMKPDYIGRLVLQFSEYTEPVVVFFKLKLSEILKGNCENVLVFLLQLIIMRSAYVQYGLI
jgi:hypothetical protein